MPNRRFPSRTSTRRSTSWEVGPEGTVLFTGSASNLMGTVLPTVDGLTIVRIRGDVLIRLHTSVAGVNEGYRGAIGMGVVEDNAVAIGITAMPLPSTDDFWEGWMWHQWFNVKSNTSTLADGANADAITFRATIDSKSMRKLPVGMTLALVVEVVEAGTALVQVDVQSRSLVKLP